MSATNGAAERTSGEHWRFRWTPSGSYEVTAPDDVPEDVVGWIGGFLESEIGGRPGVDRWLADRWRELRAGTDNGIGGNGLFLSLEGDEVVGYDTWDREMIRFPAAVMDRVVADFGRYRD